MNSFIELLEQAVDENTPKAAVGKKLGGGVIVKHDSNWKMAQRQKRKWEKTPAGKKSAKMSKIRTSKSSYIHKKRQGINRAQNP